MAEGTYEYECMRAELLGIERPNEEEFEKARAERLKQQEAEREAAEADLLTQQEEGLKNTGSKLDELNSILSSTQQKLNRFKQTACGSLSNIFSRGASVDGGSGSGSGSGAHDGTPSTSATSSRRNTTACASDISKENNLNAALDKLDEMQETEVKPVIPTEKIRNAKLDIHKKMGSHLDKLDSLVNKAENAEVSMSEQTKQMRKMAK